MDETIPPALSSTELKPLLTVDANCPRSFTCEANTTRALEAIMEQEPEVETRDPKDNSLKNQQKIDSKLPR